jgi:FkbM family methyltransferase
MNHPRKLVRLLLFTRSFRLALLAWRLGIPWLHLERRGKEIVIKGTNIPCEDLPDPVPEGFSFHAQFLEPFEFRLQVINDGGHKRIRLDTGEVKLWLDAGDVIRIAEEVFGSREYGIRAAKESVVIDIGMNVATTSLYFANEPNVRRVVAFEPSLSAVKRAERNLALNPAIAKKIEIRRYALGDANRKAYFQYCPEWEASGRILQAETSQPQGLNQILVEIRDAEIELQSILSEASNSQQIILKVDCEGSEREIFRRLSFNTLSRIDVILMEWHSDDILREIAERLEKSAFRVLTRRREIDIGVLYAFRE